MFKKEQLEIFVKAVNVRPEKSLIDSTGRAALLGISEESIIKCGLQFFYSLAEAKNMGWLYDCDNFDVNFNLPPTEIFSKFTKHLSPNYLPDIKQFHTDILTTLYPAVLIVPVCNRDPILVFKNIGTSFDSVNFNFKMGNLQQRLSPYIIYSNKKFSRDWPRFVYEEYGEDELHQARKGPKFYPEKFIELPLKLFISPSWLRLDNKGLSEMVKTALRQLDLYISAIGKNKTPAPDKIRLRKLVENQVDKLIKRGIIKKNYKQIPSRTICNGIELSSKIKPKLTTVKSYAVKYLTSIGYTSGFTKKRSS